MAGFQQNPFPCSPIALGVLPIYFVLLFPVFQSDMLPKFQISRSNMVDFFDHSRVGQFSFLDSPLNAIEIVSKFRVPIWVPEQNPFPSTPSD
jgi:hypothetical protein